ncbi:MarR family winged helix-turn-helix transcriptional regulator [Paenibacillus sp. FJAT-27812]|uniref:MarR family winged helix-turn-helix transcriptional regulator n=1 Tax=Paenibacillus sp. FJAT-27812 TaxID=1684143 RepID=UPI0006A76FC6|nr:MarR family transcriptional regulator [Paenibacillus sp. FJAT-27812]
MTPSKRSSSEVMVTAGDVLQSLFKTTHQLHQQFEAELIALHIPAYLTGPRLRFLIAVSESAPIRMSDLAAKIGIKARTVTQFVDALEHEKLIVRVPDPEDRRATFIQLSDSAPPLIQKARAAMGEAAEKVLATLPGDSRKQLLDILDQLEASKANEQI